jgi:hypothetical protein
MILNKKKKKNGLLNSLTKVYHLKKLQSGRMYSLVISKIKRKITGEKTVDKIVKLTVM